MVYLAFLHVLLKSDQGLVAFGVLITVSDSDMMLLVLAYQLAAGFTQPTPFLSLPPSPQQPGCCTPYPI